MVSKFLRAGSSPLFIGSQGRVIPLPWDPIKRGLEPARKNLDQPKVNPPPSSPLSPAGGGVGPPSRKGRECLEIVFKGRACLKTIRILNSTIFKFKGCPLNTLSK